MTELHTEPREEEELSTADMAAAKQRTHPEQENRREPVPPPGAHAAPAGAGQAAATPAAPARAAQPAAAPAPPAGATPARPAPAAPLFLEKDAQELRARWATIQTAFVDNPRQAVQQADSLVAQTIKHLAEVFAQERNQLEQQWSRGDNVSTEDLRIALQRYRSFFDRLLSV